MICAYCHEKDDTIKPAEIVDDYEGMFFFCRGCMAVNVYQHGIMSKPTDYELLEIMRSETDLGALVRSASRIRMHYLDSLLQTGNGTNEITNTYKF